MGTSGAPLNTLGVLLFVLFGVVLFLAGVVTFGAGVFSLIEIGVGGHPSSIALLLFGAFLGGSGVFLFEQGRRMFRNAGESPERGDS